MNVRTAITVHRDLDQVRRLWESAGRAEGRGASVTFKNAPGDRGTEVHVDLGEGGGVLGALGRAKQLARAKDELRRFKQRVETGVIARSDAVPEGELVERKFKQRPARPLEQSELTKAGV